MTGPYADTSSISFSAMFFFSYSWVSLCPGLSQTCHELTKQTKMAAWWAAMSLFRFGFTRKSLDTVTKSADIQATLQLNSTNKPGDERKAESQPGVFSGKSKRDRNTKCYGRATFLGLYTTKKRTPCEVQTLLFFPPKLLTNLAPCSLEMVPLVVLPFSPMLKVKLTSSVLKQTLLGKTQVPHLW